MLLPFILTAFLGATAALAAPQADDGNTTNLQPICATNANPHDIAVIEQVVENDKTTMKDLEDLELGDLSDEEEDEDVDDAAHYNPNHMCKKIYKKIRTIKIHWHNVAANNTREGGYLKKKVILKQVKYIQKIYKKACLRFYLKGVNHIYNADWFNNVAPGSPQEKALKTQYRHGDELTLNIYSVGLVSTPGLLGYSTFPWNFADDPHNDGIVIHYATVPGGDYPHYDEGAVAVHEVGHWVGLLHTFQGGCSQPGDFVSDTPAESTPAFGCPKYRNTCASTGSDPIHNFMDYTYDKCKTHLTKGQLWRLVKILKIFRKLIRHH
ncbi:hypothetical protein AMATHDRAFT_62218 [Amanita thiersii Skay4041]|uniref:Peptidase M43 pregnancy-associated plasma-A domain-containing protein n=1 Tax=Amanita thiersii Skay4041 TaxID=703135 RepID=A0A2A9NNL3_9AGAR|nr:hypothetical protein AMATHDRAFT_62218 [Amanita thiersii Skay4041]